MAGESQATPKTEPDPSVMTTEQLDRAVDAMRDYVDLKNAILKERLDGIDKATDLLADNLKGMPSMLDREVTHLKELKGAHFQAVAQQFADRDLALTAAFAAQKEALTAAFAAQKEAASKSEQLSASGIAALSKTVDDLKERVFRSEAREVGGNEKMTGIYAALAGAVAILTIIVVAANGLFSK